MCNPIIQAIINSSNQTLKLDNLDVNMEFLEATCTQAFKRSQESFPQIIEDSDWIISKEQQQILDGISFPQENIFLLSEEEEEEEEGGEKGKDQIGKVEAKDFVEKEAEDQMNKIDEFIGENKEIRASAALWTQTDSSCRKGKSEVETEMESRVNIIKKIETREQASAIEANVVEQIEIPESIKEQADKMQDIKESNIIEESREQVNMAKVHAKEQLSIHDQVNIQGQIELHERDKSFNSLLSSDKAVRTQDSIGLNLVPSSILRQVTTQKFPFFPELIHNSPSPSATLIPSSLGSVYFSPITSSKSKDESAVVDTDVSDLSQIKFTQPILFPASPLENPWQTESDPSIDLNGRLKRVKNIPDYSSW